MICIGHRGASGTEPENTLRSIRRALEVGAHGVEIDVRLVGGELIIFHDSRLQRTTNGRGSVARQSFARLRELDAGQGEQIPTLREVCAAVDRRGFINIELKGRGTARPVAALIAELVRDGGWEREQFLISSFLRRELRAFRLVDAETPLGVLFTHPNRFFLRLVRRYTASAIHLPMRRTSAVLVRTAHQHGIRVYVYTVNEPADLERMQALGVDGVFTDFPERLTGSVAAA